MSCCCFVCAGNGGLIEVNGTNGTPVGPVPLDSRCQKNNIYILDTLSYNITQCWL
uniref:Uncharacterized protein n=1 Tax=Anguilla anguilla TaxID=7936 RepID=A0A0E9PAL4_ANGAN